MGIVGIKSGLWEKVGNEKEIMGVGNSIPEKVMKLTAERNVWMIVIPGSFMGDY